ncbi:MULTISPECIES: YiaA/YiaB family inner membrane protein [unclassified Methylobacterium]|uniref:YiaA/YiaB family inner membrane protein n=1 Tax=unclassified Methylobacterium TaxID=2615210 RepID=UPI001FB9CFBE|nr:MULTISPECIES: YiaA/YiaB family inner membrane protein [unclassified Methylobacterium]MCJ2022408.1 hypothetical protein [Methylobacterium sp. E-065]
MIPQMPHTGAWKTFTLVSFAAAAAMLTIGIFFLPADIWIKGYLAMASLFLTGTTFTLAKTLRDEHEANRLINKIEDAATERVLREAIPGRL